MSTKPAKSATKSATKQTTRTVARRRKTFEVHLGKKAGMETFLPALDQTTFRPLPLVFLDVRAFFDCHKDADDQPFYVLSPYASIVMEGLARYYHVVVLTTQSSSALKVELNQAIRGVFFSIILVKSKDRPGVLQKLARKCHHEHHPDA